MMKLPAGFGNLDWSDWLRGVVAGFVTGGSTAGVAIYGLAATDPAHAVSLSVVWSVFLAGGVLGMLAFLRQKPLPDMKKVETTVEMKKVMGVETASTTTVKETVMEPIKADGAK